jgi:hypothetical protein
MMIPPEFLALIAALAVIVSQTQSVHDGGHAAPASFKVIRSTIAVEACTKEECHPIVGFFSEGVRGQMTSAVLVDGEFYTHLQANGLQGWVACHIPRGPPHYVIISDLTGAIIFECADYSTK